MAYVSPFVIGNKEVGSTSDMGFKNHRVTELMFLILCQRGAVLRETSTRNDVQGSLLNPFGVGSSLDRLIPLAFVPVGHFGHFPYLPHGHLEARAFDLSGGYGYYLYFIAQEGGVILHARLDRASVQRDFQWLLDHGISSITQQGYKLNFPNTEAPPDRENPEAL